MDKQGINEEEAMHRLLINLKRMQIWQEIERNINDHRLIKIQEVRARWVTSDRVDVIIKVRTTKIYWMKIVIFTQDRRLAMGKVRLMQLQGKTVTSVMHLINKTTKLVAIIK